MFMLVTFCNALIRDKWVFCVNRKQVTRTHVPRSAIKSSRLFLLCMNRLESGKKQQKLKMSMCVYQDSQSQEVVLSAVIYLFRVIKSP